MLAQLGTKLVLGFALELPDALTTEVERAPDLLEGQFLSTQQAEPVTDDVSFAVIELDERFVNESSDLFEVQLVLLAARGLVRDQGSEAATLVLVDEIVNRAFPLKQRNEHRIPPGNPLA